MLHIVCSDMQADSGELGCAAACWNARPCCHEPSLTFSSSDFKPSAAEGGDNMCKAMDMCFKTQCTYGRVRSAGLHNTMQGFPQARQYEMQTRFQSLQGSFEEHAPTVSCLC